jgi:hypothetical protein
MTETFTAEDLRKLKLNQLSLVIGGAERRNALIEAGAQAIEERDTLRERERVLRQTIDGLIESAHDRWAPLQAECDAALAHVRALVEVAGVDIAMFDAADYARAVAKVDAAEAFLATVEKPNGSR